MRAAAHLTPMFRQYDAHKREHPEAILLFRMGDFYEMFYDDAKQASTLLELTLTARGKGTQNVVPMCGFPHHQLEAYAARLVRANHKVAICEQVEDPRQSKGLVRREVVRVITPGTITDPAQLDSKANAWLCGLAAAAGRVGAAFLDASTGEFLAWETAPEDERPGDSLADRLRSFAPREIVHPEGLTWPDGCDESAIGGAVRTPFEPYPFTGAAALAALEQHLGVASLEGFGMRDRPAAVAAAGGLLQYARETQKCGLEHIDGLAYHEPARYLLLDPATRRNLEIETALRDGGREGSLMAVIDMTVTPAGARLLRRWLLAPLLEVDRITARQEAIEELLGRSALRQRVRELLRGVQDVERIVARIVAGTANARELLGLSASLEHVPDLLEALGELRAPLLREIDGLDPCGDLAARVATAIVDEPPVTLRDGGVIRDGHSTELDELRGIRKDARSYIASLEARERAATGIASLKVRHNKVFGYYIEVSKANLALVPEHYQRKQTIAGGERYITPELTEHESRVLNAQERIASLEVELFVALRRELARAAGRLKTVARATARIDVIAGLAELAGRNDYCRPHVDDERRLRIVGGRHPAVERALPDRGFVPNDTELEYGGRAVAVLTGPNMGGKSTYLRQVALIAMLAQVGSFVPADEVEIGIVDRIFCRVGASDNLAEGQSTFMVEMAETANILRHATSRSLILLDEIGRGTSTFDGLSIAWAVVEHLHALQGGAPRTLFATHYHELTELAVELTSVINLRMAVREWGDSVVFQHRVEPGAADRSYGIHVARLAGVPLTVVERAREILANLERDEYGKDGLPRRARRRDGARAPRAAQGSLLGLFHSAEPAIEEPSSALAREVLAELRQQDPDRLTPLEALQIVAGWHRRLSNERDADG